MNLTAPSSIITLLDKNPNYFRCSICKKLNFLSLEKSKKKNEYSVLEICQNHHKNEFSLQNYISEKQTDPKYNFICSDCNNQVFPAKISFCKECNKYICYDCKPNHLICHEKHKLYSLNKFDILCMKHFNPGICFDIESSKYCCTECIEIKEKNKIITPVDYSFNDNELDNISKKLDDAKKYLKDLENTKISLVESLENIQQTLKERFDIFYNNNQQMINLCSLLISNYKESKKYNIYEDFYNIKNICNFKNLKNFHKEYPLQDTFTNIKNYLNFIENKDNTVLLISTGVIYFPEKSEIKNEHKLSTKIEKEYLVSHSQPKKNIKKIISNFPNKKKDIIDMMSIKSKNIYKKYKNYVESLPPLKTRIKVQFYDIIKTKSGYYYGEWSKTDLTHGRGLHINDDGSFFVGYFENGEPQGYGKYKGNDRETIAIWKNNKRVFAKEKFSDGIIYKGYYNNNLFNNIGILYDIEGNCYKGEFNNGVKCGFGIGSILNNNLKIIQDSLCKEQYIGEYKKGNKDGFGFIKFDNGNIIAVNFEKNKFNGYGIMLCSDDKVYLKNYKKNIEIDSIELNEFQFNDEISIIKNILRSIFETQLLSN